MSESLKQKTVKGVMWNAIGSFSTQGVSFIISIILARLLLPSDYGIIAMLGIFTALAGVFIDSGLANALIRKQDRTEADLSTMFYYNVGVSSLCYAVIFVAAPWIAAFYNTPELALLARVTTFTLVLNSFCTIQRIQFNFRLDFKTPAKIGLFSTIVAGLVGIISAYIGLSYWALVIQFYVSSVLNLFIFIWVVRWYPKVGFSKKSFKELFGYSSKLLASGIMDNIYNQIYPIVIGKAFSAADLGLYGRASSWSRFPSVNITSILRTVTFPVLSTIQDDDDRLAINYRRMLRVSGFIIFPLMIGLAAIASPLTLFVLGEQWADSVPLLHIICFDMMWYPIHAINLNLLQVKGRSDLFLQLEIIKKAIGISILFFTIPMGLIAMCCGGVISSMLCLVVNTYYTGKLIHVGFGRQFLDLLPTITNSLIMGLLIYLSTLLITNTGVQLFCGIAIGAAYYISINYFLKPMEWQELISIINRK